MGIFLATQGKNMFREIDEQPVIDVAAIDEIQVAVDSAPVHVTCNETGSEANFHYYGKSLQEINLTAEVRDKILYIKPSRKYVFFGTAETTHLDIRLPAAYRARLAVKTTSSRVTIESAELAGFTLNTSSGGLEAGEIKAGKIVIHTTSGRVQIEKIRTDELEIKGSSAAINIGECLVVKASIKNTSGKVALAYREFEGRQVIINTSSGGMTLGLPETAGFEIEARMTSGKLQSDFTIDTAGNTNQRHITGRAGIGNNKVTLQTTSGQIMIIKNARE